MTSLTAESLTPPDNAAFIEALRRASTLIISTAETPTLRFDVSDLLATPALGNIDACEA